jgi:molybdopterin molybdotransferase
MASSLGLQVKDLGIARDNESELERLVSAGLASDLFILTGGVSMGQFDLVPGILSKTGVEQIFHKIAIKPGKPIWFGVLRNSEHPKYVFGLPGNPVSSLVGFHLFVRTAVRLMTGAIPAEPTLVMAELSQDHEARGDRPTYWPSRWVVDDTPQRKIAPLVWKGSSDLMALGQAEALIYFEAGSKIHRAGEFVRVFPLS